MGLAFEDQEEGGCGPGLGWERRAGAAQRPAVWPLSALDSVHLRSPWKLLRPPVSVPSPGHPTRAFVPKRSPAPLLFPLMSLGEGNK